MPEPDGNTLGPVGLGSFGALVLPALASRFRVIATDRRDLRETAEAMGARWESLQEAAGCAIVVLPVPVRRLRPVLQRLAPDLRPGTLVADVASVKGAPVQWMLQELPDDVEILGTHSLFGLVSAADGLEGHRIVLCPVCTERLGPADRRKRTARGRSHACHGHDSGGCARTAKTRRVDRLRRTRRARGTGPEWSHTLIASNSGSC